MFGGEGFIRGYIISDDVGAERRQEFGETAAEREPVTPAPGWSVWREKVIGEVRMQLLRREDGSG